MVDQDDATLDHQRLIEELEACRRRVETLEDVDWRREELLEDLSLHREELRTQNDELRAAQVKLEALRQRYKDLFDHAPAAHFVLDRFGTVSEVNLTALNLLGIERSKIIQRPFRMFIRQNASRHLFERFMEQVARGDVAQPPEIELETRKGRFVPVQLTAMPCSNRDQPSTRISALDVSDRHQADEQRRLAATVFEASNEGIVITDPRGNILRVNRAFTLVTGYHEDEAIGRTPALLASGRHDPGFYHAMWEQLENRGAWRGEIWNKRKSGEIYPEWLSISAVRSPEGKAAYYVGIFSDITDKKRAEVNLERFAHFDQLTGLPNRVLFQDRLKQAMVRASRNGRCVALLFLDLDRFKAVNDSLGHQTGDLLLQRAAGRIRRALRKADTVARIGGDEFTVIMSDLEEVEQAVDVAARVAQKIAAALARPFRLSEQEVVSGTSVGIAIYPQDGETVSDLIKHADTAMYEAKASGGNGYVFFSAEMTEAAMQRLKLEAALRQALQRQEFRVEFQPQIDGRLRQPVGAEALLRWTSDTLGPVSPEVFVPVLEDMGLMTEVGWWVLRQARDEALAWRNSGYRDFRIAFNFSPRQFRASNCLQQIQEIIRECNGCGNLLTLEVTEGHMMADPERSLAILREIRKLGVRISMDDFGTGYSSLSLLHRFPIDELKIDRSFVQDLAIDEDAATIVSTIVLMARSLGIEPLAEGVESEQQARLLIDLDCPLMQGFLWARAMPSADLAHWRREFARGRN